MKDDAVGRSDRLILRWVLGTILHALLSFRMLSLLVLAYLGETYQTASRGEDQEEDGKDETG